MPTDENIMDKIFNIKRTVSTTSEISEKENFLVTGIGGFVGSNLANMLKSHGNVIGILRDVIPSDWLSDALNGCTIIQGDIRNFNFVKRVVEHYKINTIYHLASFANVKQAMNIPVEVFESNVMGTLSILESVRGNQKFKNQNNGTVIVLNTDKVYGEKTNANELDCYHPSEIYATSKCCQGFAVKSYRKVYDLNIKMAHSCNIFGYDPFNDRLIPNTIKSCIRGKSPVIYTNDDSIREYIYIDDVINALYMLNSDTYDKDTYNIATGWTYNQRELVKKITDYYNDINFEDIKPIEKFKADIPIQIQNQSLTSYNWNWKPSWTFDEAISQTVDDFLIYKYDWI